MKRVLARAHRGARKLLDGHGTSPWRCMIRMVGKYCTVEVKARDGEYLQTSREGSRTQKHTHTPAVRGKKEEKVPFDHRSDTIYQQKLEVVKRQSHCEKNPPCRFRIILLTIIIIVILPLPLPLPMVQI